MDWPGGAATPGHTVASPPQVGGGEWGARQRLGVGRERRRENVTPLQ